MTSTRSGWMPRFLVYRSPQFWAVRSQFVLFNVVLGFGVLAAILVACWWWGAPAVASTFDRDDAVHRLARPVDADERRRHVVRVSGHIQGGGATTGVCLVTYETHGKNGWYENSRFTYGDGAWLVSAQRERVDVAWASARWAPDPPLEVVTGAREAWWREHLGTGYGGRHREACLRDVPLFVSGCRDEGVVRRCAGEPLVLTPGDGTPQPLIDERAAWLAGRGSLLGVALTVVLLYLFFSVLDDRPLTNALLANAPERPFGWRPWVVAGAAPLLVLGGARLLGAVPFDPGGLTIDRDGYAAAALSLSITVLAAVGMRARRLAIVAACAPVIDTPTRPLAEARGGLVEVAVEVDPTAPLTPGPLSKLPRAFSALTVLTIAKRGKNYQVEGREDRNPRPLVPVRDASGSGVLDLSSAATDIRSVRVVVRPGGDEVSVVEERFLERGETVYVLGHVETTEPAATEAGYREAAVVPRIASILVYAGSERSLLRSLAIERAYLRLAEIAGWSTAALIAGYALGLMTR